MFTAAFLPNSGWMVGLLQCQSRIEYGKIQYCVIQINSEFEIYLISQFAHNIKNLSQTDSCFNRTSNNILEL